jgi:hypothetical protein
MKFYPKNFRQIAADNPPGFKIRTADHTTLILIKSSGDGEYARTRMDKDQLIARFDAQADLLLWAWVGQYHTDIFMLTRQDLDLYYKGAMGFQLPIYPFTKFPSPATFSPRWVETYI